MINIENCMLAKLIDRCKEYKLELLLCPNLINDSIILRFDDLENNMSCQRKIRTIELVLCKDADEFVTCVIDDIMHQLDTLRKEKLK